MMKKLLFILLLQFSFLFLIFLLPSKISAQGTCRCIVPTSSVGCVPTVVNCDTGYSPVCSSGSCGACTCSNSFSLPSDIQGNCKEGIDTAIGCIPVLNFTAFMGFILKWAIGVGGGIAFLLILYGGFIVMTSTGNPERLKAGQELLTSAISGLILLIFSIFVLKFIGIDILGLGALGFGK